jgi:CPA1 family monovalent cation:H+ antiporter
MDFRRDFATISALSVGLVIITSVGMGLLMRAFIPDLHMSAAIALGAVLSPTDAVATKITKRLGAPPRIVTVLEGEGLLNDASALVILRSAVAASAATVSAGQVIGDFVWAVIGAVICGAVVGFLSVVIRKALPSPALTTGISFVVPFAAYVPAEHLGASGLVAVVVAGLITGYFSARYLSPQDRFFERTNWATVELLLEGGIFLLMGLEVHGLIIDVHETHDLLWESFAFAAVAAVALLAVRALYVWPLLVQMRKVVRRRAQMRERLEDAASKLDRRLAETPKGQPLTIAGVDGISPHRARRLHFRVQRSLADTDYLLSQSLGTAEGGLLVMAGMRGVITLAAAQTLPHSFPHRSFVIMLAFFVAAGSLLLQGGTLPWVTARLGLTGKDDNTEEAHAIYHQIENAAAQFLNNPNLKRTNGQTYPTAVVDRVRSQVVHSHSLDHEAIDSPETLANVSAFRELWLRTLVTQRGALLHARETGSYDSRALDDALRAIDAEQIGLEMKPGSWLTPED